MSSERFLIRLTRRAESAFCALPQHLRQQVRDVMDGIAQVAGYMNPVDPKWLRMPGQRPPLLRVGVSGLEVLYTIDAQSETVAIWSVVDEAPSERLAG